MFVRFTRHRAPGRKRLTSAHECRTGVLSTVLLAASCCMFVSACSDDDKATAPASAVQAQDSSAPAAPGAPGASVDASNALPAAALTIQTPAHATEPSSDAATAQATAQPGEAASGSLAPPVIHTVD
jgi:hypothetical protein